MPQGQPGYLRVDTVHQGDRPQAKGVYHIVNAVDEVTQWQVVAATARISGAVRLEPVLAALLREAQGHGVQCPVRSGSCSPPDAGLPEGLSVRAGLLCGNRHNGTDNWLFASPDFDPSPEPYCPYTVCPVHIQERA